MPDDPNNKPEKDPNNQGEDGETRGTGGPPIIPTAAAAFVGALVGGYVASVMNS